MMPGGPDPTLPMPHEHPFLHDFYDGDLTIRLCGPSDIADVETVWSHPSFMRMFPELDFDGSAPDPTWLRELVETSIRRRRILAIENDDHGLVGTLVVHFYRTATPTLGWYVDPEHRSKGYATRAAWMALERLNLVYEGVRISVAEDNEASLRVLGKLEILSGMLEEEPGEAPRSSVAGIDDAPRPAV